MMMILTLWAQKWLSQSSLEASGASLYFHRLLLNPCFARTSRRNFCTRKQSSKQLKRKKQSQILFDLYNARRRYLVETCVTRYYVYEARVQLGSKPRNPKRPPLESTKQNRNFTDRNEEINQTTFIRNQNRKKKRRKELDERNRRTCVVVYINEQCWKGRDYVAAAVTLEWNIYV